MQIKRRTCCFTGHRTVSAEYRQSLPLKLEKQIRLLIQQGIVDFIAGGARGFDTMAALAVLKLREEFPQVRLLLALPCKDQTKGWPLREKLLYDNILQSADTVHYLSEAYTSSCMMQRNRFMVDHSEVCVFFLTAPRGGTYKTVEYALAQNLRLCNILTLSL